MKVGDYVKLSAVGHHISWLQKYQSSTGKITSHTTSELWMVRWSTPSGTKEVGMKSSDIQVTKKDVDGE